MKLSFGHRMRAGRVLSVLLVIVTLALLGGPGGGVGWSSSQETVRIGVVLSLSGDLASFGERLVPVAQMAIDHVNEQGGILGGKRLELILVDDETNPRIAAARAAQLADEESVHALFTLSSASTIAVLEEVTAPAGIPHVTVGSAINIRDVEDHGNLFRFVTPDDVQAHVLSKLVDRLGYTRVAIVFVDDVYGRGFAEVFAKGFADAGGVVTANLPFESGAASYRSLVESASREGAEALVVVGYPESGAAIVNEALASGSFERFFFSDGLQSSAFLADVTGSIEGSWGTGPSTALWPASSLIDAHYAARYGAPQGFAPLFYETYNALFVLALAIETAGSVDGKAITEAMRRVSDVGGLQISPGEWRKAVDAIAAGTPIRYHGTPFPLGFDAQGDLVLDSVGLWTVFEGEIRLIGEERLMFD